MMRGMMVASLLLGGCTTSAMDVNRNMPAQSEGECDAGRAQALVGRAASSELGAEALRLTGARTIRWIQPDQAVTMDYRMDRLNIELDARNRVTAIRCG